MCVTTKLNGERKNKGITLIALVITIIVLLILAGISIAMLTGDNGILKKATTAKEQTEQAQAKEKIQLEVLGSIGNNGKVDLETLKTNIRNHIPEATISGDTFPLTVTVDGKTFIIDENGNIEESGPTAIIQEIKLVDSTGAEVTVENKPEEGQEGYQASFKVALTEAGTINSVTYNGTEITGTNGEYKIPVTENKTYKVSINFTINGKTETKERDVTIKDLFKSPEPIKAEDIASNEETFKKVVGGKVLNYGTDEEIEWKVFYADNSGIYLITSDYVPVSKLASQKTSLGFSDNGNYNISWSSPSDFKVTQIDDAIASKFMLNEKSKFTTPSNPNYQMAACLLDTASWETFRDAKWADENNVIGGPTLEMYVASWNKKYPENKLYTKADGTGYYVGTSENPTTVNEDMSNTLGYQDELYYPHREIWNSCYAYWLATPSAINIREINISYHSVVGSDYYYSTYCGVRPLVHLRSDIKVKPQGENFVLE